MIAKTFALSSLWLTQLLLARYAFMQRLSLATAERLERLLAVKSASPDERPASLPVVPDPAPAAGGATPAAHVGFDVGQADARDGFGWFRGLIGWAPAAVTPQHSLGEE